MHDWKLALIVLLLVGIDVLILGIFLVVEGVKDGGLDAVKVPDRENPMHIEGVRIIVSKCSYLHSIIIIIIFRISKGLLHLTFLYANQRVVTLPWVFSMVTRHSCKLSPFSLHSPSERSK